MGKAARKKAKELCQQQSDLTTPSPKKQPATPIIASFLFLGPASAASNLPFLQSQSITQVLSIGKSPATYYPDAPIPLPNSPSLPTTKLLTYHRLALLDTETADITAAVDAACVILDDAASKGERVLIHCSAAISRSPAVVAGYLIRRRGYTLKEAMRLLVAARRSVAPNQGFIRQLEGMETENLETVNPGLGV